MQWITRERPKIDRIANETGAIPYDIPGVELTHVGELCSFDAFLNKYQLGWQSSVAASRQHRARCRYVAAGAHAAIERALCNFAGSIARVCR